MWYLQFHDVCAKIFVSMATFFIDKSSNVFLSLTGRSFSFYHIGGFLFIGNSLF